MRRNATILFEGWLASTPAGENPFVFISNSLHAIIFPAVSGSFHYQLYILASVYGLDAILLVISLVVRARRQGFKIFHRAHTARGTFLVAHHALAWQLATLAFAVLLIPFCILTDIHVSGETIVRRYTLWRLIIWLPSWISAWFGLWALYLMHILPNTSTPREKDRFLIPNILLSPAKHPAIVNFHFCAGVTVGVAAIVLVACYASAQSDRNLLKLRGIRSQLIAAGQSWPEMSSTEVQEALVGPIAATQSLFKDFAVFIRRFHLAWTVWSVLSVYLYSLFVLVGLVIFHKMGVERRKMKSLSDVATVTTGVSSNSSPSVVASAWNDMAITITLLSIIGVVFCATSIWFAIETEIATNNPVAIQVETLLSMWMFAIAGFMAVLIVLRRSLQISRDGRNIPSVPTTPRPPLAIAVDVRINSTTEAERDASNVFELDLTKLSKGGKTLATIVERH
ncbi:hypothetical protein T439DRAFT_376742 [Meredithblackwellia eburnea MCA 4105]